MILELFSIFDSKASAFVTPIFSPTIQTAMRDFETACNDTNSGFNRHPGDYTLMHLGTFNQHTGKISLLATPANLGLALTFLKNSPASGMGRIETPLIPGDPKVTAIHGGE